MASSMLSELTCISCCPACSCIYRAEKKDSTRLDSITSSVPAFWLTIALQPLCRSASMAVSEMQVLIVTMHPERALASCCSCSRTPRLLQTVTHLEKQLFRKSDSGIKRRVGTDAIQTRTSEKNPRYYA